MGQLEVGPPGDFSCCNIFHYPLFLKLHKFGITFVLFYLSFIILLLSPFSYLIGMASSMEDGNSLGVSVDYRKILHCVTTRR